MEGGRTLEVVGGVEIEVKVEVEGGEAPEFRSGLSPLTSSRRRRDIGVRSDE